MFAAGLCFFVLAFLIDQHVQGHADPDGALSSWPVVVLGVSGMALMFASLVLIAWRVLP